MKLSALVGDMISQEAFCHAKRLVTLYNKAEMPKQSTINGSEKRIQDIALAQLVAYVQETHPETKGSAPIVFRLAERADMYSNRLQWAPAVWHNLEWKCLAQFTLLILKKGS